MRQSTSYRIGATIVIATAGLACGDSQRRTLTTPTSVDLAVGRYALTVSAGLTCTELPDVVRARTYTASITSGGPDQYVVTLSDARFLEDERIGPAAFRIHCGASAGLGCNQFTASRDGDQLRFHLIPNCRRLNNEFAGSGGSIVELLPPADSRLGFEGSGPGRLDGTTIRASIDGRVWYCPATFSNYSEECAACDGANVAMTFTRR